MNRDTEAIKTTDELLPARIDLACCYRAAYALGWHTSIIYNHITLRVPGTRNEFLINPFGLMYQEVTASDLIKIDTDGNKLSDSPHPVFKQGFVVHSALHMAREDVACVIRELAQWRVEVPLLGCRNIAARVSDDRADQHRALKRQGVVARWFKVAEAALSSGCKAESAQGHRARAIVEMGRVGSG